MVIQVAIQVLLKVSRTREHLIVRMLLKTTDLMTSIN